ncbi:MAG: G5 domain-containing protein, partial [Patescibacteria group bacterium]
IPFFLAICGFFSSASATFSSDKESHLSSFSSSELPVLRYALDMETDSCFKETFEEVTESVPFSTQFKESNELSWGEEKVLQEGKDGQRIQRFKVLKWQGEVVQRDLVLEKVDPPEDEVILRGKKIDWKKVPGTGRSYWAKLHVWATSYDGNCRGCNGVTYTGTSVKHGVCAVDPRVIPLGTKFFVPGYGVCQAEDIGGAIRGNAVDLGFKDVTQGFWSARYTDVYLLDNAPSD